MHDKQDLSSFRADPTKFDHSSSAHTIDIRTAFQRDRDRILYSKAFRRLARKTQVFFSGHDDHIRTRLTHTLEVSQIARTISSRLGLNDDLTEAIALGHDIGHAPFGHVGERVINSFANGCECYKDFNVRESSHATQDNGEQATVPFTDFLKDNYMGFKHNWQAVRIVEDLARHRRDEIGLGLTPQTVFGILYHTKLEWDDCSSRFGEYCKLRERGKRTKCSDTKLSLGFYTNRYSRFNSLKNFTIEAVVVAVADEIAQRHHDVEDGLRFKLFEKEEVIDLLCANEVISTNDKDDLLNSEGEDLLNSLSSILVSYYVIKSIGYIKDTVKAHGASCLESFICKFSNIKELQDLFDIKKIHPHDAKIKSLLKHRVLYSCQTQGMDGRADFILRRLFKAYISNPQQLPDTTIRAFFRIYKDSLLSIGLGPIKDNLNVDYNSLIHQSQIDTLTNGQLREILKYKHNKGKHVYKGSLLRVICDLISGMTDHKAELEYKRLYGVS